MIHIIVYQLSTFSNIEKKLLDSNMNNNILKFSIYSKNVILQRDFNFKLTLKALGLTSVFIKYEPFQIFENSGYRVIGIGIFKIYKHLSN